MHRAGGDPECPRWRQDVAVATLGEYDEHSLGRPLELDPEAAERLANDLTGTNVTVEVGDSTSSHFAEASFDSVGCFTMLHHLPTAHEQFRTLCEAFRVLRPGGVLVGADSLASQGLHEFHEGDTYNPIDPARLLVFLQAAGFGPVMASAGDELLFTARKASEERSCE